MPPQGLLLYYIILLYHLTESTIIYCYNELYFIIISLCVCMYVFFGSDTPDRSPVELNKPFKPLILSHVYMGISLYAGQPLVQPKINILGMA